ncbi:MAG: MFS transporter [Gemmatimonadaceae bacterium]
MATSAVPASSASLEGIRREQLFVASCCALAVSAVAFAVIGDILTTLKAHFVLTNLQVGYIGGAAVWGFSISILLLGPLCDVLGLRFLVRSAMVCHVLGIVIMVTATGFWTLFAGALTLSLGNGLVEAACNPLVATLYPDDKTHRLNMFHVWWPGGIVLGGLASYGLHRLGFDSWQIRLGLVLLPAAVYIVLMARERFPATENVQRGVSAGEMFRTTFTSPLFLLMLGLMFITASIELGPNRWLPAVLEAGGIPGILVLVWISGLMALLRMKVSGPLIRALSPTGILFFSVVFTGIGLYILSFAETGRAAFLSATVFALGIAFIWPTMLGFVSERIPRSGALGLALMGGAGMGIVGIATSPILGKIADEKAHERLVAEQPAVVRVLRRTHDVFTAKLASVPMDQQGDVKKSVDLTESVLRTVDATHQLPSIETANALRSAVGSGVEDPVIGEVQGVLGPAENFGGRVSFRYCVPLAALAAIAFALLYLADRRRGGYQVVRR